MDNSLKDLYAEARQLFDSGKYAKAEGKCRELIRLAKQRGDNATLAHGYMLLATCLERLEKVITIHDSRELAQTHFFSFFFSQFREAVAVCDEAQPFLLRTFGDDSEWMAKFHYRRAAALRALKRFEEARRETLKSMSIFEKFQGQGEEYVSGLLQLATTSHAEGN